MSLSLLEGLLDSIPAYVLVAFRVGAMMLFGPLFGSARIPRRMKVVLGLVLAFGIAPTVPPPVALPETSWGLAIGIGGELVFGFAMGMALSLVFVAAQWAGEMIGQQMGLNLSEVFDPQFGAHGSLIGEFYFMFTLVIFLNLRGHHAMLSGLRDSFEALPLLGVGMTRSLLDLLIGLIQSCATLAFRLAGPTFITMLVVDVVLGFIGKTIPQINIMTAGLAIRPAIGLGVILLGLTLSGDVITDALADGLAMVGSAWTDVTLVQ